ncbi:MAG: ABC transporter ATP-binding protein [Anaerorhabdus sp.]|uniref:ABC transporter ATP-binding protein n=2 Tax=Anaerorhabdus sp. TaxID=1872524 RepID=UPI002B21F55E|nr:ABC transporter ATP-binding protein [Anaerorhabdus sp.]MEA4875094.1 ABC transporter ATP-binding protein [Anaerorhabdus sp.]
MEKIHLYEQVENGADLLQMVNITKIYENGFVANNDINFSLKKGEIHGLVGENGAGKTTLMKVLFGQEIPEQGKIMLGGKEITFKSPLDALQYGIGMVHQHFMLVDTLSVADNMVLGNEPKKGILYNKKSAREQAIQVSKQYDLEINPDTLVRDLSVGMKQRVEILKILLKGAKILLLDEPTAVLTPQETQEFFVQLQNLKNKGFSIVFISHKLNEVKKICDRITIIRRGQTINTVDIDSVTEKDISNMMVGYNVESTKNMVRDNNYGEVILKARNLSYLNNFGKYSFKNLDFDVRSGEILGVAAVEGNGQSELANVIAGLFPITEGELSINNVSLKNVKNIRQIRELGVSLIHEDRMDYGVSVTQSISENIVSDRYYKKPYSKFGILNNKKIKEEVTSLITEFTIKCDGGDAEVKTLSGGNIQKVIAAREFTSNPKFILACQPTRGIDIGAAETLRRKMIDLKNEQKSAILLFSADLHELLTVSDTIIVLYGGSIVAYFSHVDNIDEQTIGEYMLGIKKQTKEELRGAIHD